MASGPKASSTPNVRAVTRALEVLNSFAGRGSQTLAEVTNATGLDKGTTRRLLITLMQSDFIAQDSITHQYKLGRAIRELASNVEDARDLRVILRPVLEELAVDLSVTAFLSVFKDDSAVCLDRVHDMRGIEVHWWTVGGTLPLNVGGAPKLLLAYQPDEVVERLIDGSIARMNEMSITSRDELIERLKLIRDRGWECAVDDVALGLTALAIPIFDRDGSVICALSVAGLTPQMMRGDEPIYLERLQKTAAKVRRDLGIHGDT
ncbi:IclR family transcriptional regulator [Paracoccus sp. SCSIO 75233]|uniref:IclR family transcriptional regulator n=1 Tax=Paracoccus sp. SCSIO 75233 TaxID=3017782 RepID=UPI0022F00C29|nr:IclR family transcriptional regulator [Paracoccus sp. SCSIO 75233]WBU52985.1 IclR family transcriptional regulator [Paracoccus sp. SCSIO 75233]